ncbi:putative uncharacterized protein DDB_G0282133 [Nymphalis io]|uniref:putative uncharacterized protein DDB_G0282133 n=1 Tax=Inachis io TaxID=171585 RepID=UPI00216870D5|nr:putative uncharacterized protein DDB_G0282133 [Nymphalis io]
MIEDETDEECIDDPIRLFDFEQDRVFCCSKSKGIIEDASHEDNIRLNKNLSDYEETVNSNKSNSSILPVTFFDIESNVELLNKCRPLFVKLVDCNRFPSYHKLKMNVRDYSNLNLNKSDLQEADCIEILSSDENENDLILKQTTLEDIMPTTVGNKKFSKLGFVSKNDTISKRKIVYDTINSYQNNKVIDQGIIDFKESQKNIITNAKSDNKTKLIIDNQHSYTGIRDERMNTYARIINKAYKKLTSRDIEKPFKEIKTRNTSNKSGKPDFLVDNTKINCIDMDDFAKNKFNGKNCNNKEELLKRVSNVIHSISEENKGNNVFNKEMQTLESTIGNNNGSSSPLLPCPSKIKRSDQINGIHITQNTVLPSYAKHKINKNVCEDQLFSANRVIPHFHYESVYATQKSTSFNLNQNASKNATLKTGCVQTNIERVSCEVNDKNKGLSKQCNKNKRTNLVEPNVTQINNITHNNHSICKANHSLNHVTHLCKNQCCSQANLSQKQTACNHIREKSRNLGVNTKNNSISSLDATKGNSNPIPVGNSIPISLDRQPNKVHYNNYITPTYPIQRVESNQCNSHSNDLTFQASNVLLANDQPSRNIYQSNIYLNNTYSLEHSLSNMSNGTKTVTGYEDNLSPSFYSIPLQLTPINLLPEYRNDHSRISRTQFQHHYINYTENVDSHINSKNRKSNSNVNRNTAIASVIPDVNQNISNAVENTKHSVASEVVNKHPYLKQCLERPSLLKNKPTNINREKRKCVNNTESSNLDKTLNKGYSPPILPIPTYQKTFEILAKINLYDFDRGFSQPDLSDNCIPSSRNFYVLEKTACKRKINDVENVSGNITLDEYKKRITGDSIRK